MVKEMMANADNLDNPTDEVDKILKQKQNELEKQIENNLKESK